MELKCHILHESSCNVSSDMDRCQYQVLSHYSVFHVRVVSISSPYIQFEDIPHGMCPHHYPVITVNFIESSFLDRCSILTRPIYAFGVLLQGWLDQVGLPSLMFILS